MHPIDHPGPEQLSVLDLEQIDRICNQFESAIQTGDSWPIESIIAEQSVGRRRRLLYELIVLELDYQSPGEIEDASANLHQRFPDDATTVNEAVAKYRSLVLQRENLRGTGQLLSTATPSASQDGPGGVPNRIRYLEDYELLEQIGRGGMGVVYRARERGSQRTVAIKMMLTGEHASAEQIDRFILEARTAAKLEHHNIIRVYEIGYRDGSPYFVMDFVDGETLETLGSRQRLSETKAAGYVLTAARAIQFAHESGVLHRDLKPSNLMIDRSERLLIMDFGLAKFTAVDASLTPTGVILGTPGYLSPEQARGKSDAESVGVESDVYGLGAILYFLLTGRAPFVGDSVIRILADVAGKTPTPPRKLDPSISPELESICLRCLEKDPARRYRSAADLERDLKNWILHEPIQSAPRFTLRGNPWLAYGIAGVAAVLICGMFLWSGWFRRVAGRPLLTRPLAMPSEARDVSTASGAAGATVVSAGSEVEKMANVPFPERPLVAPKPADLGIVLGPRRPPRFQFGPNWNGFEINLDGPPAWHVVPSSARAISVVGNLSEFSSKVDHVARLVGSDEPSVLARVMKAANISKGLNVEGSLMWVWGQRIGMQSPVTYYVPSEDHTDLISRMRKRNRAPFKLVEADDWELYTIAAGDYSLFAVETDLPWLKQCRDHAGQFNLVSEMGDFNHYLARQDIGVAVTRSGMREGVDARIPLIRQDDFKLFQELAASAGWLIQGQGIDVLASGAEILVGRGVRASAATYLTNSSPLAVWGRSMYLSQKELLGDLPDGPAAVVIGLSSCPEWNRYLRELTNLSGAGSLDNFVQAFNFNSLRGVTVLVQTYPTEVPEVDDVGDLPIVDVLAPFHVQISVDDSRALFDLILKKWIPELSDPGRNNATVKELKVLGRDVISIETASEDWPPVTIGRPNLFRLTITTLDRRRLLIQGGDVQHLQSVLESLDRGERLFDDTKFATALELLGTTQHTCMIDISRLGSNLLAMSPFQRSMASESSTSFEQMDLVTQLQEEVIEPFRDCSPFGFGLEWGSRTVEGRVIAPENLVAPLYHVGRKWIGVLALF